MALNKKKIWGPAVILLLIALPFLLRFIPESSDSGLDPSRQFRNLNWKDLRTLDFKTGEYPSYLEELLNSRVRIPGFIVPLEDDAGSISEFLLVPSPQACIHVPPPPPNQMVHVFLEESIPYQPQYRAVFVTGKVSISEEKSRYGASSFQMQGDKVEPFRRSAL